MYEIDIPFTKFVLKNGLTLLVHEDRKAPIVAVNVWYHVGSKNERPGKTGFAHLFEHLMFNGSEHFNEDYFQAMERLGATDMNGTTSVDRTNYFQNVPTSALDTVLWLESDRMGHMVGAIDQAKLEEQRGVVKNEKRQGEDQPYGKVWETVAANTYPQGHPYSWMTIGSMEDIDGATLDDVKDWFRRYYGAANAVLVLAGDIDAETARAKVETYFGDIPPGPPVVHPRRWIARRSGEQRVVMQDRVPQGRVLLVWNVPEYGAHSAAMLDLLSDVLGSGKTSRLYKRLVYQDQVATDASAYVALREMGGQFLVQATARPGVPLQQLEAALREELAKLLQEGPTQREMQRVRTQFEAGFVRGIERIGGFGGKSDILAMNQVYLGDPAFYKTWLGWVRAASAQDLLDAGREWLRDGVFALEVHPYPEFVAATTGASREVMPEPGDAPPLRLPGFRRATLSNGLRLLVAERHDTPQVQFDLIVPGGHAADSVALAGCAGLAMALIDEGTARYDALELSEELALLAARLEAGSSLDAANVSLSALRQHLDASLALFAEVILRPTFPDAEFTRLRNLQLDAIRREKMSPVQAALRVFPRFLFGTDHAYGKPYSGAGTEESVASLTPDQVRAFHAAWFKPNHAVLTVVGDTSLEEVQPKLEALFAGWAPGDVPPLVVPLVDLPHTSRVVLIDKPEATQSVIVAGHIAPPTNAPNAPAIDVLNAALGGMFTSRINMNLREEKHWTYGARSVFLDAVRQRPFLVYTSVQADKTREAMAEILKEIRDIRTARPLGGAELAKAQANLTLELPGSRETLRAIREDLERITIYGLADDYFQAYPRRVQALDEAGLQQAAEAVLQPDHLTWVVVGDLARIRTDVETGQFGSLEIVQATATAGA